MFYRPSIQASAPAFPPVREDTPVESGDLYPDNHYAMRRSLTLKEQRLLRAKERRRRLRALRATYTER